MSISASLSNALTGLTAASRAAQVVSNNVANSMTEGYARRELSLSSRGLAGAGAGVQIDGVVRIVDETILRERRLSAAAVGSAGLAASFSKDVLSLVGTPEDAASLSSRVIQFETALIEAASRPESDARLSAVLTAAQSLVGKLSSTSDAVQRLRRDADASIGTEVNRLNDALVQVSELNGQILRAKAADHDFPALLDQQQKLIDQISNLVPIRQIPRENGSVALYTMGGALLLDIEPAVFEFLPTAPITADMTQDSGALSGLMINGQPILTGGNNAPIAGGVLAELFAVRDDHAIVVQGNLDEVARDLISRFEDAALDPTQTAGDPGLFTDGGSALDLSDLVGLAARVSINAAVDPGSGGATWRLRDGLYAAVPGPVGDSTLLNGMRAALEEARIPIGGSFSGAGKSVTGLVTSLTSLVGQSLQDNNNQLSFRTARFEALEDAFFANGVDTDQEMQKLLLIEQAYAANARVIQTADELIQILIRI